LYSLKTLSAKPVKITKDGFEEVVSVAGLGL